MSPGRVPWPRGRLCRTPPNGPAAFVHAVHAAAETHGAEVILPTTEPMLRALGEHAAEAVAPRSGCGPLDGLALATDKLALAQALREVGVPTPETVPGHADPPSLPAIAKPATPTRTESAVLLPDEASLAALRERVDARRWVLQPYVRGTLAAICGVAWEGRVVAAVHQQSPRTWPPAAGVSSFARTIPRHDRREAAVARLIARLGWSGLFELQFLATGEAWYAIDLNPRVYGSLALAVAAGQNLPAIWTELLLGREPDVRPYRLGVHYRVTRNDLRWVAAGVRAGELRSLRALLPHPRTTHACATLSDPVPGLAELMLALRRQRGRPRLPGADPIGTR
jgi:predicted ATP-grasp superfamily ATP-dependent carboligase